MNREASCRRAPQRPLRTAHDVIRGEVPGVQQSLPAQSIRLPTRSGSDRPGPEGSGGDHPGRRRQGDECRRQRHHLHSPGGDPCRSGRSTLRRDDVVKLAASSPTSCTPAICATHSSISRAARCAHNSCPSNSRLTIGDKVSVTFDARAVWTVAEAVDAGAANLDVSISVDDASEARHVTADADGRHTVSGLPLSPNVLSH